MCLFNMKQNFNFESKWIGPQQQQNIRNEKKSYKFNKNFNPIHGHYIEFDTQLFSLVLVSIFVFVCSLNE